MPLPTLNELPVVLSAVLPVLLIAVAGVAMRKFDGSPEKITEMDALIAYLQVLGTMVDFKTYQAKSANNLR